jgi:hypothetical protein
MLLEGHTYGVSVVCLVDERLFDAGVHTDTFLRHHTIEGVTRREDIGPPPTLFVNRRMFLLSCPPFISLIASKLALLFRRGWPR